MRPLGLAPQHVATATPINLVPPGVVPLHDVVRVSLVEAGGEVQPPVVMPGDVILNDVEVEKVRIEGWGVMDTNAVQ